MECVIFRDKLRKMSIGYWLGKVRNSMDSFDCVRNSFDRLVFKIIDLIIVRFVYF